MNCKFCNKTLKEKKLSKIDDFFNDNDVYYQCPLCSSTYSKLGLDLKLMKKGKLAKIKTKTDILQKFLYIILIPLMLYGTYMTNIQLVFLGSIALVIPLYLTIKAIVYIKLLGRNNAREFNVYISSYMWIGGLSALAVIIILFFGLGVSTEGYRNKVSNIENINVSSKLIPCIYDNGTKYYVDKQWNIGPDHYIYKYIDDKGNELNGNITENFVKNINYSDEEPKIITTKEVHYGENKYPEWLKKIFLFQDEKVIIKEQVLNYEITIPENSIK